MIFFIFQNSCSKMIEIAVVNHCLDTRMAEVFTPQTSLSSLGMEARVNLIFLIVLATQIQSIWSAARRNLRKMTRISTTKGCS